MSSKKLCNNICQVSLQAMDCPIIIKNVKIKDGAHIGMGAIILPGVTDW